MTLCKFRPQRTYGEQFLLDEVDVRGLMKALEQRIDEHGEADASDTRIYVGAHLAFNVMFRDYGGEYRDFDESTGERPEDSEYWTDFMRRFDAAVDEQFNLEGGD
ncbi:MAG: hypothetical protein IJ087_09970 [Eggerthellaceae bacterium]|nr:hypothetical protein [Eggerthellaceae bacterium]